MLHYTEGWDLWYWNFITPTITHLLLCQKEDYRHKQVWPIQWVQREQLQPDNGSHGDGYPAVQREEVQHWPLPLLLSGFSPVMSHCLLRNTGTWILSTRNDEQWLERKCECMRACVWVSISLRLLPAPCLPGLYPKPCNPDLWTVPEPIPGVKTGYFLYFQLTTSVLLKLRYIRVNRCLRVCSCCCSPIAVGTRPAEVKSPLMEIVSVNSNRATSCT